MKQNEIVLFETEDQAITLSVPVDQDTVWLSQLQMAELFSTTKQNVSLHINNCFREKELDKNAVVKDLLTTAGDGKKYKTKYYNLDVIISVGYRVKSQRGVEFRRWANSVLKNFILQGYAVNERRLQDLQKTIDIQTRIIANTLDVDQGGVLQAVNEYTQALTILDQYDHQSLEKPEGNEPVYRITYKECRAMIDKMEDSFRSAVFGVEKEPGKVEGIIAAVYQEVFGTELYPSIEEKASNLLYFMIKDHPFADGCKRIGASLFLEFLNKNNALYRNGIKCISNGALVAITLMIAESNPTEKDIMVAIVMNLLNLQEER